MAQVPVRNIAEKGVIADVDAHDLNPNVLSMGVNIRCENGHAERGPIFRRVGALPQAARHVLSFDDTSGATQVHFVGDDGNVYDFSSASTTSIAPAFTPEITAALVTSCVLNGVVYVNREDRTPWYRPKDGAGPYQLLSAYSAGGATQALSADVRFRALRATAGILVGINVTDQGINIPNKIKWSTIAANYGLPPGDWDIGSTTNQAGENILAEMTGSLVDGLARANSMILYGTRETWLMEFTGDENIFNFRRLFDSGVINVNCVVERDGVHYVFGNDDIYVHDGTGRKDSLAQSRVRKFIFNSMVRTQASQSFVVHNSKLTEIMFCYVSADQYCKFRYEDEGVRGCNKAAVYNYTSDCWYFYDLPYVTHATVGPVSTGITWDDLTTSWDNLGGSWDAMGETRNAMLTAGNTLGSTAPMMRSFDTPDSTATNGQLDQAANGEVLLLKTAMSFETVLRQANPYKTLYGNNLLRWVEVEGILPSGTEVVYVSIGSSFNASTQPTWSTTQSWELTFPRIDCNEQASYISLKFEYAGFSPFRISGYNLDVMTTSRM